LNVQKGKKKVGETGEILKPISFQIREMYHDLTNTLMKLGIEGLSIKDRLYVDGREIRNDQRFLPNPFARPYTQVDPSLIEAFIENPPQSTRHYKCIQVTSWEGELVFFIFLRFSKMGQSLFVEVNYFLLPPVKEQYRKIDTVQPTLSWKKKAELINQSVVMTPLYWIFSPLSVIADLLHEDKQVIEEEIEKNPSFDYGANRSIREHASSSAYRQFFQMLDKEMYVKIIERQILDSVVDFLESKDIDTTSLREQQTMILNSGVIVSGGSINAENLAVGEQARASSGGMPMAASQSTQQELVKNLRRLM
jgi:hypothetical protein